MRAVARLTAAIALAVPLGGIARAQEIAPDASARRPLFLPGAQYGAPLGLSAGLTVFMPISQPLERPQAGWLVEGGAGRGGARASAGLAEFIEYVGLDVRAVAVRTGGSPRDSAADSAYAGVEAGISIACVRLAAGVAHRVAGAPGPHATLFTWSVGLQFPFERQPRESGSRADRH